MFSILNHKIVVLLCFVCLAMADDDTEQYNVVGTIVNVVTLVLTLAALVALGGILCYYSENQYNQL